MRCTYLYIKTIRTLRIVAQSTATPRPSGGSHPRHSGSASSGKPVVVRFFFPVSAATGWLTWRPILMRPLRLAASNHQTAFFSARFLGAQPMSRGQPPYRFVICKHMRVQCRRSMYSDSLCESIVTTQIHVAAHQNVIKSDNR